MTLLVSTWESGSDWNSLPLFCFVPICLRGSSWGDQRIGVSQLVALSVWLQEVAEIRSPPSAMPVHCCPFSVCLCTWSLQALPGCDRLMNSQKSNPWAKAGNWTPTLALLLVQDWNWRNNSRDSRLLCVPYPPTHALSLKHWKGISGALYETWFPSCPLPRYCYYMCIDFHLSFSFCKPPFIIGHFCLSHLIGVWWEPTSLLFSADGRNMTPMYFSGMVPKLTYFLLCLLLSVRRVMGVICLGSLNLWQEASGRSI